MSQQLRSLVLRLLSCTLLAGALGAQSLGEVPIAPEAAFRVSASDGVVPFEVQFADLSTGEITSWSWDFGDGTTSDRPAPSHVYVTTGDFDVRLTVTGPAGRDSTTQANLVRVSSPDPPSADLAGAPATGDAPLTVSFSDLSTGGVTAWSWSFGDGASATGAAPSHTYEDPGTYTVSLTVIGPAGVDSTTRVGMVTAGAPARPSANFVADVVQGFAPLTVRFSDLSAGHVSARSWSFGDGETSNAAAPTHVYGAPGRYTVTLTVTGLGGSDETRVPALVDVQRLPVGQLADGDFELQTAGAAPEAPWLVLRGADHVIHPDAPDGDGGPGGRGTADLSMPVDGTKWLEVSAQGTIDATPPSNPGGVTEPPAGGAGVAQDFLYPEGRTVLELSAAFVLDGDPGLAAFNDWMSIDVSDGTTTHNVFYRDGFSEFEHVSRKYGLAATRTARVRTDLALLFPESTPFTPLRLTIQVGNGGDSLAPSRGYVDDVRFLEPVESIVRYGCGTNPEGSLSVLAGEPSIGSSLTLGLDNPFGTQGGNATSVVLVSFAADPNYPCGTRLPGFGMSRAGAPGELLVRLVEPDPVHVLVGRAWHTPGVPAPVTLEVPNNPMLVGQVVYAQGYLVDDSWTDGIRIGLTDALELLIGE